jgi:hypothetical protein
MEELKQFIDRNKAWLKQRYIASQIGCNPVAFSNWMTGKRPLPPKYEEKLREVLSRHGLE